MDLYRKNAKLADVRASINSFDSAQSLEEDENLKSSKIVFEKSFDEDDSIFTRTITSKIKNNTSKHGSVFGHPLAGNFSKAKLQDRLDGKESKIHNLGGKINIDLINKYKSKLSQLDNSKESIQAASKSLNTTKSRGKKEVSLENRKVFLFI